MGPFKHVASWQVQLHVFKLIELDIWRAHVEKGMAIILKAIAEPQHSSQLSKLLPGKQYMLEWHK